MVSEHSLCLQPKREDLRRRFVKAETTLFKVRYDKDLHSERESFLRSRDFNWIAVSFFFMPTSHLLTMF